MNGDGGVSAEDHRSWVKDLKHTWFGDADLNNEFNSNDFVRVFQAGKYEQGWLDRWGNIQGETAGWSEGDWNGDGVFDSNDFVTAFVRWRLRTGTPNRCGDRAGAAVRGRCW